MNNQDSLKDICEKLSKLRLNYFEIIVHSAVVN